MVIKTVSNPRTQQGPESPPKRPQLLSKFRARVAENPTHPAVEDPKRSQQLSYGQLEEWSNVLAAELKTQSTSPFRLNTQQHIAVERPVEEQPAEEQRIAVFLQPSCELLVAALAAMKVGAAYVPLDPGLPADRLQRLLEDAEVDLVLSREPLMDQLPMIGRGTPSWRLLDLDRLTPKLGAETKTAETKKEPSSLGAPLPADSNRQPPTGAAYLIFTSGSTGNPKGVVISHEALAWYLEVAIAAYGLSPEDRVLQMASIGFDLSVCEIFPTLAAGATVVLHQRQMAAGVPELCRLWESWGITVLYPPTALWHELARGLDLDPHLLPASLRLVSFGGEKVSTHWVEVWHQAVGHRVSLFNGYGPTEITVEATVQPLAGKLPSPKSTSQEDWTPTVAKDLAKRIGKALPEVQTHVLAPHLEPVAINDEGELFIAGSGLARGYHRHPALTATRFLPNPWSQQPGGRLYRTGDLARQHADSSLTLLGRIDRQVKIRGFRVEPGEIETRLQRHPKVRSATVVVPEGSYERYLVAFVVPTTTEPAAPTQPMSGESDLVESDLAESLQKFLRRSLPSYMVPQRLFLIDSLPMTPNGKVDHFALLRHSQTNSEPLATNTFPNTNSTNTTSKPSPTDLETTLTRLWCQVLRIDRVEPQQNFFSLGGDSILGLRLVSLAHQQGLPLTPQDLFTFPTPAVLASAMRERLHQDSAGGTHRESVLQQDPGALSTDPFPLTPVQRWFFEDTRLPEYWHFNQSMLVRPTRPLATRPLRRALEALLKQHDVLRLRFSQNHGAWQQRYGALDTPAQPPAPLIQIDLSRLPPTHSSRVFTHAATAIQSSLDVTRGPMLRCAHFRLPVLPKKGPPTTTGVAPDTAFSGFIAERLLMVVHHLAVDGVTWGILWTDLESAYLQAEATPDEIVLPPKTTSYRHWAELQTEHAKSQALARELEFWRHPPCRPAPLATDFQVADHQTVNTAASTETLITRLNVLQTSRLLQRVPEVFHSRINDALLAALLLAWQPQSSSQDHQERALLIDLEGHGREDLFPGVDLSRTAGWFTSTFPVALHLPAGVPRQPATVLKRVKEQLRALPQHGVGFGMLYYLGLPRVKKRLRSLPKPEISFNYFGQLDALLASSRLFKPSGEEKGLEHSPKGQRSYLIEIDGGVTEGRLWIRWRYSRNLHRKQTIRKFALRFRRELQNLIRYACDAKKAERTPSDFPLAQVDPITLDQLLAKAPAVEDLFPLSPLQRGMLFHSLLEPQRAMYFEQSSWLIQGEFRPTLFRQAWQELAQRHGVLRSAFSWQGLDLPLQRIDQQAEIPWSTHDWSAEDAEAQQRQWNNLMQVDRHRGFDFARPPLMRVTLIKLGEHQTRFLWSYHHALLDGWSISLIFDELFQIYGALSEGKLAPKPTRAPFREYIRWLTTRKPEESKKYWQRQLAGFSGARRILEQKSTGSTAVKNTAAQNVAAHSTGTQNTVRRQLPTGLNRRLRNFAQGHGLTLNTCTQAAWAMLLAHHERGGDVVFGSTIANRPADLPGANSMVGLMINTLPVRVSIDPQAHVGPWLQRLQQQNARMRQHGHVSLADIHKWSSVPPNQPLFTTLLVFENYPVEQVLEADQGRFGLRLGQFIGWSETNYPLTLGILPTERLTLEICAPCQEASRKDLEILLDHLCHLLHLLVVESASNSASVGKILTSLAAFETGRLETGRLETSRLETATSAVTDQPHKSETPYAGSPTTGLLARGPIEEILLELWRQVLSRPRLQVQDHFFAAGGDSLTAMRLFSRIKQTFGVDLPLRGLFDHPTVRRLASLIESHLRRKTPATEVRPALNQTLRLKPLPAVGVQGQNDSFPLSFAQQRLWFLHQIYPGDSSFHLADVWHLEGDLHIPALAAAIDALQKRHEILRTSFPAEQGKPRQVIHPPKHTPMPIVDLSRLPKKSQQEVQRRLVTEEAQRPFSLARGPLLRSTLLHLGPRSHIWLRTLHHVVTDGWSENLFYHQLEIFYAATLSTHQEPLQREPLQREPLQREPFQREPFQREPLQPLPIQYADFALWQRQWLTGPPLQVLLAYWREKLEDLPDLVLPWDRLATKTTPYRAGRHQIFLNHELGAALRKLTVDSGASLFMIFTAAVAALLARWTGNRDFAVGAPVANRTHEHCENLIGFFVNLLVLRMDLKSAPSFFQHLGQVRETVLEAYQHQDLPFERLVEALAPRRLELRRPLVGVLVDFVTEPRPGLNLPGVQARWQEGIGGSGNDDLSWSLWSQADGFVVDVEYNAALLDRVTVARLCNSLRLWLRHGLHNPHHSVNHIPLLTRAEIHQLRHEWSPSQASRAANLQSLHELQWLGELLTKPPATALALEDPSRGISYTYGQMQQAVERRAGLLRRLGVGEEVRVGLVVSRKADVLVDLLAILWAGGAYVPLDPRSPAAHLQSLARATRPQLVWGLESEPEEEASNLERDHQEQDHQEQDHQEQSHLEQSHAEQTELTPFRTPTPQQAAYVLPTSGSSGKPKAVVVEHRSLAAYVRATIPRYGLRAEDRVLQFAPWNFDLSIEEIFCTLAAGATLVLRNKAAARSGEGLSQFCRDQKITFLTLPTAFWHEFTNTLLAKPHRRPPHLRKVVIGGEKAHLEKLRQWTGQIPIPLYNTYGPTEATVIATWEKVGGESPPSLGRPLPGVVVRVLSDQLQWLPIGTVGEIMLAGRGLARGYQGQPAETAQRFIPDPFADPKGPGGERLYRTGDRGRWLADGRLEFLGRLDRQLKVRGFRVEPEEIERVLRRHRGVQEVVVTGVVDKHHTRLVAHILPVAEGTETSGSAVAVPTVEELQTLVAQSLPSALVPSRWHFLHQWPLTRSGKVDRRNLPLLENQSLPLASAYAAPRNPTEKTLAELWAATLGRPSVGIHDNFFALGGDSILSLQIIAAAQRASLPLRPQDFFTHQTIAEQARQVAKTGVVPTAPPATTEMGQASGPAPLTPIQEWLFTTPIPAREHFNQSLLLETSQPLHVSALALTAARMVSHHETLRLRFTKDAGLRQQEVALCFDPPYTTVDLSSLNTAQAKHLQNTVGQTLQASLDLRHGPVLRMVHFRLPPGHKEQLLFILHHLVVDGVSWPILTKDFDAAYQAFTYQAATGQSSSHAGPVTLPPRSAAYTTWAKALHRRAQRPEVLREAAYWCAILDEFAPLPTDFASKEPQLQTAELSHHRLASTENDTVTDAIPNLLTNTVHVALGARMTRVLLHRGDGILVEDLLLAALLDTLTEWNGETSILLELESHGRGVMVENLDVSRTVGWFTATYPMVLHGTKSDDPIERLRAVQQQKSSVPVGGFHYGLLRYLSPPNREIQRLRRLPEPPVNFNYLGRLDQGLHRSGLFRPLEQTLGEEHAPGQGQSHLLDINCRISGHQLEMYWSYRPDLHRRPTIQRLAHRYLELLESSLIALKKAHQKPSGSSK